MSVECFAQRLLNPYRGVMHTIRYASAEAVTLDGVHWDIYVSNDTLLEGLDVNRWTQITDIRFGSWSQAQGLKRGPIYPSDDFLRMEAMGAMVYEYLTRVHARVPFPLNDDVELWLLDASRAPLALLASVERAEAIAFDESIVWRAGYQAAEHFSSPALLAERNAGESAADYLTRYVNQRAGPKPVAQWFQRNADGSGAGLACLGDIAELAGRHLPSEAFPPLLLATQGHDAAHAALIADFHAWQSPWLLSLPRLSDTQRQALESQARQYALSIERHYRLYPRMVDESGVKAALVEAMLLRAQSEVMVQKDNTMSTFYIELHPSPGGDRSN